MGYVRAMTTAGMPRKSRKKGRSKAAAAKTPQAESPEQTHATGPSMQRPSDAAAAQNGAADPMEMLQAMMAMVALSSGDTTVQISHDPDLVLADIRIPDGTYFLYMPPGKRDMVFVDGLSVLCEVASWDVWTKPAPPTPRKPAYRIVEVPGKGMGMVATRSIRAGELIVEERPAFVIAQQVTCAADQAANATLHRNAVDGLSAQSRAAITALKNAFPADVPPLRGTLTTNYLQLDLTPQPVLLDAHLGCFPVLSRANHACTPNANYFFAFGTFTGQFWAPRDIAEGEEVAISYCQHGEPRAVRKAHVREHYFFECACAACSLVGDEQRASDRRRKTVSDMLERLKTVGGTPHPSLKDVALRELYEVAGMAEEEGLPLHKAQILFYGSSVLLMRRAEARVVMQLLEEARNGYRLAEGEKSFNVHNTTQVLDMLRIIVR